MVLGLESSASPWKRTGGSFVPSEGRATRHHHL